MPAVASGLRRLPAEWETPSAILLAWPHRDTDWAPMLTDAQACVASIARALLRRSVPVIILTPDPEDTRRAINPSDSAVSLLTMVDYLTNDTWTRDYGPLTVISSDGTFIPLDFQFNGWGLKFAADRDNLANLRLADARIFSAPLENHRSFILEGGSLEMDTDGTLLTTSRCLLSPNRNGSDSRADIEKHLASALGIRRFFWLGHGALAGDDTDSHIDTLARFAPGGKIIYCVSENPSDLDHDEIKAMEAEILAICREEGFTPVPIPLPAPMSDPDDGTQLPATYANFLSILTPEGRGLVLVPTYGRPDTDSRALDIIEHAFEGYEVEGIDCSVLVRQHGSLHCTTMQIPLAALQSDLKISPPTPPITNI